ncbi:unnamed protein product [Amoebophrya sp. A120]|nr:unnamed protein product [Amoebophrya sp. A120]|eukprot:GSA120T00017512001.1
MTIETAVDAGWTLLAGMLVFFMQAGFTLLESGYVKARNIQSILMKNAIDASVAGIAWYLLGYGLAFGEDSWHKEHKGGFAGTDHFAPGSDELTDGTGSYVDFFFQYTFCATAATIVSGGVAERCKLEAFAVVSFLLTLVYYPLVVHWTWGGGFLTQNGYSDFAGSGVVHMFGGFAALAGAIVCGPRHGRFTPGEEANFAPSNMLYICVGAFVLWFGWYGFNAGSTLGLSGGNDLLAARAATNTAISAAFGSISSFLTSYIKDKKFNVAAFANGILGGLVGITAGCAGMDTHLACATGIISGLLVESSSELLKKLKIDDPVGAFPVHGACGIWGVIAIGLFDMEKGWWSGKKTFDILLGPNITGIITIAVWSFSTSLVTFLALKYAGLLLVSPETQTAGLDLEKFALERIPSRKSERETGLVPATGVVPEIEMPEKPITPVVDLKAAVEDIVVEGEVVETVETV